jgi:fermentation-respiration switch protein FrsA (DUF1100 family)
VLSSILRIVLLLLGAFAAVVLVVWFVQERLVFFPPPVPSPQGAGARRIDFSSSDGDPLFGFFVASSDTASGSVPAPNVPQRLIVHFHGNGDLAHYWIGWAQEVARRTGWSVFLAEYRGYGGLPGRPTYEGVMKDAKSTFVFLQEQYGVRPNDIVLYGHSLGTGVATELAAEQGARAVLLEAPITSIVEAGRRSILAPVGFIIPWISRIHFAPVDHVRKIQSPVWIACGEIDDVAPASMSESVFAAALQQGELLLVEGAQHNDISVCGGEKYWDWLSRALEDRSDADR